MYFYHEVGCPWPYISKIVRFSEDRFEGMNKNVYFLLVKTQRSRNMQRNCGRNAETESITQRQWENSEHRWATLVNHSREHRTDWLQNKTGTKTESESNHGKNRLTYSIAIITLSVCYQYTTLRVSWRHHMCTDHRGQIYVLLKAMGKEPVTVQDNWLNI